MEIKYIVGAKPANKLCEAVKKALMQEIDATEQQMSFDYWSARVRVIGEEQAALFPKCDKIHVNTYQMAGDGRGIALYSNHNAYTQSKGNFLIITYGVQRAEPERAPINGKVTGIFTGGNGQVLGFILDNDETKNTEGDDVPNLGIGKDDLPY